MNDCTCNCQCKPDSISFMWMNDNFTFVILKGKNLKEILEHANKIRKKQNMECYVLQNYSEKERILED